MNYLQKTHNEASKKKEDLENEISSVEEKLNLLYDEHRGIVQLLKSIEKSMLPTKKITIRPVTKKAEDARTGIRAGSWSEKVVQVFDGKRKLFLKDIVDISIEKSFDEDLTKDQLRKRIMNALNSLHRMGYVGIDSANDRTRYYLVTRRKSNH